MRILSQSLFSLPLLAITAAPALASPGGSFYGGHMYGGHGGGFHFVGGLFVLIILIFAVIGLVSVIRKVTGSKTEAEPATAAALRTLDDRFANSQIEEEEYTARRAVLVKASKG